MTITPREAQLLTLIWNGFETPAMAKALKISPRTVEAHRQNMYRKFHVHNVAGLLRAALDNKLIQETV
jgi:two-component system NarL family response regulator